MTCIYSDTRTSYAMCESSTQCPPCPILYTRRPETEEAKRAKLPLKVTRSTQTQKRTSLLTRPSVIPYPNPHSHSHGRTLKTLKRKVKGPKLPRAKINSDQMVQSILNSTVKGSVNLTNKGRRIPRGSTRDIVHVAVASSRKSFRAERAQHEYHGSVVVGGTRLLANHVGSSTRKRQRGKRF